MTETTQVAPESAETPRLPRVAIVGRPNVGKSALFNRLVGSRRSIVHNLPGVTRDRITAEAEWAGIRFELTDTGGLEPEGGDSLSVPVGEQAVRAACAADVTILVVDGQQGLVPLDRDIARMLRRSGVSNLVLAVNKADHPRHDTMAADFARLGLEPSFAVSAEHGAGISELLDAVVGRLGEARDAPAATARPVISIAIVGRPNVGKSTLFNALVGDERAVVSEVPGTTRDTVDVEADLGTLRVRFVDTAGIRRPGRTGRGPEVLSVVMARHQIERADVAILVLDACEGPTHQDAVVAGLVDRAGKAIVLALSKWDRVEQPHERRAELEGEFARRMKFLSYAARVAVSGRTGLGLKELQRAVEQAEQSGRQQVPTGALNRFVEQRLSGLSLHAPGAKSARILYATQIGQRPPTFVLFVNRRVIVHFSTERFITNQLRESFDFAGSPLRLRFRARPQR